MAGSLGAWHLSYGLTSQLVKNQRRALPSKWRRTFTCPAACNIHSSEALSSNEHLRPWTSEVGEVVKDSSNKKPLHVVLFSPQIPGNTGSIARTCAATSVGLHLIEPLGFKIDDTKLKRAGLDYWPFVVVKVHSSWRDFVTYFKQQEGEKRLIAFTKRGNCIYTEKAYRPGDWLIFGSEISGLSEEALEDCADEDSFGGGKVRIPIVDTYVRSLNLSVSVGIGLYEAVRQLDLFNTSSLNNIHVSTEEPFIENFSS